MRRGVFVTGTDTGCGKTLVAQRLIGRLRDRGLRVAGFKPVAAGGEWRDGELCNDDALALIAASRLDLPYATVNPYCLEPAVAPHLAAAQAGIEIETSAIDGARAELAAACDFIVVEGAGGWRVPLGPVLDIQGLAQHLALPVVLVVGLRLGCLNHALLTEQAIQTSGVPLLGWVGSQVDPRMERLNENVATLRERLVAPCLGVVGHPDSREPLIAESPLLLDPLLGDTDIEKRCLQTTPRGHEY